MEKGMSYFLQLIKYAVLFSFFRKSRLRGWKKGTSHFLRLIKYAVPFSLRPKLSRSLLARPHFRRQQPQAGFHHPADRRQLLRAPGRLERLAGRRDRGQVAPPEEPVIAAGRPAA